MKVYVICAMFNQNMMYIVGNGDIGFSSKEKALEYFDTMKQDWAVTHYEIKKMTIM